MVGSCVAHKQLSPAAIGSSKLPSERCCRCGQLLQRLVPSRPLAGGQRLTPGALADPTAAHHDMGWGSTRRASKQVPRLTAGSARCLAKASMLVCVCSARSLRQGRAGWASQRVTQLGTAREVAAGAAGVRLLRKMAASGWGKTAGPASLLRSLCRPWSRPGKARRRLPPPQWPPVTHSAPHHSARNLHIQTLSSCLSKAPG